MSNRLNEQQMQSFNDEGYILVSHLFAPEEIEKLRSAAKADKALDEHAYGRADGEGGSVRLALWNQPGDGIYGMFARCHRIVDRVDQLLDDEAYHYHSKMIMKDAKVGGAWAWHQDYGYWYNNGVLAPDLISVFIAVDKATRENGCLQVVPGSHRLGRIDHVTTGDQTGADQERVDAILDSHPLVHVEMNPGDALFFHANLLHRSDQNHSNSPRWSMVCCYNAKHNSPYKDGPHPRYTPLDRLSDDAIRSFNPESRDHAVQMSWKSGEVTTASRIKNNPK